MGGGFLRKMFESEISKNKQIVIANLGPTWDCQIWILGMWTVPYPVTILAPHPPKNNNTKQPKTMNQLI